MGKLVEGQVEQTIKALEFLSLEEIEAGYILICTACPRSDCTIVTHQAEELFS
jgi:ferredoxin